MPYLVEFVTKFPIDLYSEMESQVFLPFSANFNDGTPYQKCENLLKFLFLIIIKIVIGIVSYVYWQYKTVFI